MPVFSPGSFREPVAVRRWTLQARKERRPDCRTARRNDRGEGWGVKGQKIS
jgi:hypothetical protein